MSKVVVLIVYCYVTHHPTTLVTLTMTNFCCLTDSSTQESFVGQICIKVSQELAGQLLTVQVQSHGGGAGGDDSKLTLFILFCYHLCFSNMLLHNMSANFSQSKQFEKEPESLRRIPLPEPAGKVDQVPRTCTVGLRKKLKQETTKMGSRGSYTSPRRDAV